jgi:Family of unknown function (DUF5678)
MGSTSTGLDGATLSAYAGDWVVLRDEAVIEHGTDSEQVVRRARARGIECPRVVFVPPRGSAHVKRGL